MPVLRGTVHQGSFRFSPESVGRQCTAVAAVALCRLLVDGPIGWTERDVDWCVEAGDALYRSSIRSLRGRQQRNEPGVIGAAGHLDPWELHRSVALPSADVSLPAKRQTIS